MSALSPVSDSFVLAVYVFAVLYAAYLQGTAFYYGLLLLLPGGVLFGICWARCVMPPWWKLAAVGQSLQKERIFKTWRKCLCFSR